MLSLISARVAFHKENEQKATLYFEHAITLCKSIPGQMTEENREEIQKLLRFIGVASYNGRDFHKAAKSYLECLALLEKGSTDSTAKASQIAECVCIIRIHLFKVTGFRQHAKIL